LATHKLDDSPAALAATLLPLVRRVEQPAAQAHHAAHSAGDPSTAIVETRSSLSHGPSEPGATEPRPSTETIASSSIHSEGPSPVDTPARAIAKSPPSRPSRWPLLVALVLIGGLVASGYLFLGSADRPPREAREKRRSTKRAGHEEDVRETKGKTPALDPAWAPGPIRAARAEDATRLSTEDQASVRR